MEHLPKLIEDLALILIVGAVVALLFRSIKQPIVLGYLIAGFLVGPHMSLIPTVADIENVHTLAEIGVIFLLFSLGLEFNLKKILHIGGTSSITAIVEIVFITFSGYSLGKILGWSTMDSIFLGGMLASSSTTIIIKAFDDLGIKTLHYTKVVFGVLMIEDIVVILLLVLLPAIALTQSFSGNGLLLTIAKLPLFLVMMFIAGIFILPTFLRIAKNFLNDEMLLILYVGLCLGMVVLATNVGVSTELGAFLMGFILAESTSAEKVEQLIKPVKNLFAAVFFVSIGMMIDPALIMEYKLALVSVTLLTVFGKLISTTGGAIISGQPLKQSVQVGMSMAQIGEFAFIVATLGLSLGVISEFLFPVAVGASAITTFTTPYLIKVSEKTYNAIEKILPPGWLMALNKYSHTAQTIQTEKNWKKVLKAYGSLVFINSVISIVILFLSMEFLIPLLQNTIKELVLMKITSLVLTMGLMFPFIWGIMAKKPNQIAYKELWSNKKYSRGPLLLLEMLRITIGLLIISFLIREIFSTLTAVLILVPFILIVLLIFSKQVNNYYIRIEKRFISNLNTSDKDINRGSRKIRQQLTDSLNISPWDAHIIELKVRTYAQFVGKRLDELAWREKYGINIAYIRRGDEIICTPSGTSKLFPYDKVGIIATEEQMLIFKPVFDANPGVAVIESTVDNIVISSILVNENNQLRGLSIKESGIREKTNGLILGIERKEGRILNPVSSTLFEWNDVVWIAGDRDKIKEYYT
jgi:monovalent cation:H+ antiporter-2, CPA2 family